MEYLFEENQKFKQWWLWVILLFPPVLLIIPFDANQDQEYYVYFSPETKGGKSTLNKRKKYSFWKPETQRIRKGIARNYSTIIKK